MTRGWQPGSRGPGELRRCECRGGPRSVLVPGGALTAANNRASVAHTAPRRSGLAGDETNDGFLHVGLDPFRSALFGVAADFTDQDDGLRAGIIVERLDGIMEGRADDGIAAEANAS